MTSTKLWTFLQFCGASVLLQSDKDYEFCNKVIEQLKSLWPKQAGTRQARHSQSQGSVGHASQDVKNMLTTWLLDNETEKWSEGLRFIEMKNIFLHSGLKSSPYEAMFGAEPKIVLKTSNISLEAVEEELEDVIKSINNNSLQTEISAICSD